MTTNVINPVGEESSGGTQDILAPQNQPQQEQQSPSSGGSSIPTSGSGYVSNGNPYGQYGSNNPQTQSQGNSKPKSSASSGMHTNLSTYTQGNQQGTQRLGEAVTGKVETSADLARKNLSQTQTQFSQGVDQGSIQNRETANQEALQGFQNAAGQQAQTRSYYDNTANFYDPTQQEDGTYSAEDQSLIDSGNRRVTFGDGSTQDFSNLNEAQSALDSWNNQNAGYNIYGEQQDLGITNERLAEILNANYQGPNELHQMSNYGNTFNQFQNAQALQDLASQSGDKSELLRQTFDTNREYSRGNQLLDNLLLGTSQAGRDLQERARNLGNTESGLIRDELQQGIMDARTLSGARAQEMDTIRNQARADLNQTALDRQGQIDNRLDDVIANWDALPQHFRERFQSQMDEQDRLSELNKTYQQQMNDASYLTSGADNKYVGRYLTNLGIDPNQFRVQTGTRLEHRGAGLSREVPVYGYDKQAARTAVENHFRNQYGDDADAVVNFNPNALNVNLSQQELDLLGLQGGEGLYNILSQEGGLDNLLRTVEANRDQLISRDEQSQLARLQGIAELANDYDSINSGIDFRNQYTDMDKAGTQTAMDALDMDNFARQLGGAEQQFRDITGGTIVTGTGRATADDGGMIKTTRSSTQNVSQNLGDMLNSVDGYRNIYNPEESSRESLLNAVRGYQDGSYGGEEMGLTDYISAVQSVDPLNLAGRSFELGGNVYNEGVRTIDNILGKNSFAGDVVKNILDPLGIVGGVLNFGNAGSTAQGRADEKAYRYAQSDLKNKTVNKLNDLGYSNQIGVDANEQANNDFINNILSKLDLTNL